MTSRILIDALPIGGDKITGVGRYVYELVDRFPTLAPDLEFDLIVPPSRKRNWDTSRWEKEENLNLITEDLPAVGPKRQLYFLKRNDDQDLFHSTTSYLPFGVDSPTVATIHDLKYLVEPSYLRELSFLKRHYISFFIKRSARRADHIITVSESTAADISNTINVPRNKITPIKLGPSDIGPCTTQTQYTDREYILTVGELRPHKNIQTLIDAYRKLRAELTPPYPDLVIVGSDYRGTLEELEERISDDIKPDIHFMGRVSDDKLACLYRDAEIFAFPSKYEGFGLPIIEAMSFGTPVVASNVTSIPEVAGDAAILFDPNSSTELKEGLYKLLTNPSLRETYSQKSMERYSHFDWDKTANETIAVYRDSIESIE
jgi:glycosyltransferase involved in cell wall biosynthesis